MKAYLVQRGYFENRKHKTGIDSIIKFNYMGSTEFEFGALPESLKEIRKNISNYIYQDIQINNKNITVFYDKKFQTEILEYLIKLALNDFHLKEYSDFNNYIYDRDFYSKSTFWWDLQNHLMFWCENDEFTVKFQELIK